jgi:hypothetical protein
MDPYGSASRLTSGSPWMHRDGGGKFAVADFAVDGRERAGCRSPYSAQSERGMLEGYVRVARLERGLEESLRLLLAR